MESVSTIDRQSRIIEHVLEVIEYFAVAIEVFAVAVITISIISATHLYLKQRQNHDDPGTAYRGFRGRLGSGLLLGLEILVAADVVRTVALEPTLESAGVLGLLVVIRIALSWSLVVEIEHRWPWQSERPEPVEE
jgi:uncharacterized membrane protein